jgi:hypothetical protein
MMPPLGERIRFQADANFSHAILKGLRRRQPTMDLQTAEAAGLAGVPDPEVLACAAAEGRVVLSHDYHTMLRHFGDFLASGRHCAGLFLLHQTLPIGQAIELIELAWEVSAPEEYVDALLYLP